MNLPQDMNEELNEVRDVQDIIRIAESMRGKVSAVYTDIDGRKLRVMDDGSYEYEEID